MFEISKIESRFSFFERFSEVLVALGLVATLVFMASILFMDPYPLHQNESDLATYAGYASSAQAGES